MSKFNRAKILLKNILGSVGQTRLEVLLDLCKERTVGKCLILTDQDHHPQGVNKA